MCRATPFSARALRKRIFFDIVVKNKSKCGLSWPVLLSTTSTFHYSFPEHFFVLFLHVERKESLRRTSSSFAQCSACVHVWAKISMNIEWRIQVWVGVFNCQQIVTKIFFRHLWYIERRLAWHWWNPTDLGLIDKFLTNQKLLLVYCYSENRATSQIRKVFPNKAFFTRFGGKNGGVLSTRMRVVLDSLFARPGSAPIGGGKKGEFRDWTK